MRANELRIGNLVKHIDKDSVFTVKGIDLLGIDCENDIESMYSSYEMLYYVKLTEEWLLKFGFASNPYQDRYEKGLIHVECDKTKGKIQVWIEKIPRIRFEYVHQLQNLYFALTGEELTYGGNK
jgi:hypothetical protein